MLVLGIGDSIEGDASAGMTIDYVFSGLVNNTLAPMANGQLPATKSTLYTAATVDTIKTVTITNTDSVARTINLYYLTAGGTSRRLFSKDYSLSAGHSLHTDFEKVTELSDSGGTVTSVSDNGTLKADNNLSDLTDAGAARIALNAEQADPAIQTHIGSIHAPSNADNTAANETSHADVLVAGDIGTTVQAFDTNTAKTDIPQEYTSTQNFNATSLISGANVSWDLSINQVAELILGHNAILDNPINQVAGATYIIIVKQDATGSRTLSFGTDYKWSGGVAPVITPTATTGIDIISFVSDGITMYGSYIQDFN